MGLQSRCVHCSKIVKGTSMKYHSKYVHKRDIVAYGCLSCKRKFNSLKSLGNHVNNTHNEQIIITERSPEPLQSMQSMVLPPSVREPHLLAYNLLEQITLLPSEGMPLMTVHSPVRESVSQNSENNFSLIPMSIDNVDKEVTFNSITFYEFALKVAVNLYGDLELSRKHAEQIIAMFENIFHCNMFNSFKQLVMRNLNGEATCEVLSKFNDYETGFSKINTQYKCFKELSNLNHFITFDTITFAYREESELNILSHCKCTGSILPLSKVLIKFLEIPNIFEETLDYIDQLKFENKISNIMQTDFWKNKVQDFSRFTLPLFLYEDDFECGNPLGSHSGVYKMSGIYVSLPFLPPRFRSRLDSILLFQIAHSTDIADGTNVYRGIIKQLNNLCTEGIEIIVHNQKIKIYFKLALIIGDNLSLNTMLGFNKSFNSNLVCRFCKAHKNMIQKMVEIDNSLIRDKFTYNIDVVKNDPATTGIRVNCVFNDVMDFHVTENLCVDIMHDLLEGVCAYDLGFILHELILVRKLFTIETLNFNIKYFNYPLESNKPPPISLISLKNKHIKMSASEMKCFILNASFMLGNYIDHKNLDIWKLYLTLRKILCIVLKTAVSQHDVHSIKRLISEHHSLYLKLSKNTLKPKHHNMLHYAKIMEAIGPLSNIWTMRFEAKHRILKKIAQSSSNKKNLPKTIAMKYQLYMCKLFISSETFEKHLMFENLKGTAEQLPSFCNVNLNDYICVKNVTIEDIKYFRHLVLRLDNQDFPSFGRIRFILKRKIDALEVSSFAFIFQILECIRKDEHLQGFQLVEKDEYKFVLFHSLKFTKPNNCVMLSNGGLYVAYDDYNL